jgi:hypothetical protein
MRLPKAPGVGLFLCIVLFQGLAPHAASAAGAEAAPNRRQDVDLDSYWKATEKRYRAGKDFHTARRWAAGQYVVEGETVEGERDTVTGFLLVRKEKEGWVVEIETVDKRGEHLNQALVSGLEEAIATDDAGKLRLLWIKSVGKDGTIITTQQGLTLDLINHMARPAAAKLIANIQGHESGGAVKVPAGSFANTSLKIVRTKSLFYSTETRYWCNQAVPVNGLVKRVSEGGRRVIELLDFGFNGKPKMIEDPKKQN